MSLLLTGMLCQDPSSLNLLLTKKGSSSVHGFPETHQLRCEGRDGTFYSKQKVEVDEYLDLILKFK